MASDKQDFERRVAGIEARKLAVSERGVRRKVGKDGLVEYVPRRGPGALRLLGRPLVLLALFVFAGKVGLFRALGPEVYAERLAALREGDQVRRAGAVIMSVDPATLWLSDQLDRFL